MLIELGPLPCLDILQRRTVIIVEDSPPLLRAMSSAVAGMDLIPLPARHGDAAIDHLDAGRVHLVCIDIGLPNKSGYELCEYLRSHARFARVPILATAEYGTSHDLAQAEYAGANGFLRKPFSTRDFVRSVRTLLDGRPDGMSPMRELALACSSHAFLPSRPIETGSPAFAL
jgi:DNA-binding response OmpR family regulator